MRSNDEYYELALAWAAERLGNTRGKLEELDLVQAVQYGYLLAKHDARTDEDQLRQAVGDNAPDRYR